MAVIRPKAKAAITPKGAAKSRPISAAKAAAIRAATPDPKPEESSLMSINKVILLGRLGGNPELRYTPGGAPVCNFSIATNESWKDKEGARQERTEWHHIVVWGKSAESCQEFLHKGSQVFIEGKLQTRQWQDKEGQTRSTTEVQAMSVQFLDSRPKDGSESGAET